jgi:hypothetical protein
MVSSGLENGDDDISIGISGSHVVSSHRLQNGYLTLPCTKSLQALVSLVCDLLSFVGRDGDHRAAGEDRAQRIQQSPYSTLCGEWRTVCPLPLGISSVWHVCEHNVCLYTSQMLRESAAI